MNPCHSPPQITTHKNKIQHDTHALTSHATPHTHTPIHIQHHEKTTTRTHKSTGVTASDEVATTFQDFKLGKGEKLRYIIYKIEDQKTIVIEKKGERSKTYEDFCADLPEDEPRYGLVDLEFKTTDGRDTSKLVMITWNPDNSKIKLKMLYSGSKEAMKTAVNGVGIHINATDHAELDFETSVLPVCQKFG